MITKLFQLSREDPPSFAIIKDLFDFIDLRRDGIIDMNEWMQSFRLIEVFSFLHSFYSNRANLSGLKVLTVVPRDSENHTPSMLKASTKHFIPQQMVA
jgi:hypothetical protein